VNRPCDELVAVPGDESTDPSWDELAELPCEELVLLLGDEVVELPGDELVEEEPCDEPSEVLCGHTAGAQSISIAVKIGPSCRFISSSQCPRVCPELREQPGYRQAEA